VSETINLTITEQETIIRVTIEEENPITVNFFDIARPDSTVIEAKNDAEAAATAAATSASNAATYLSSVQASATAAEDFATAAEASATNASTSATNAATSATTASTQATNAATSATAAETSATNASSSATAAGTSETNAATSATNASTSATNAANSATAAANTASSIALTTKGDLLTRDASAYTRKAIGANGKVLTADSSDSTGMSWSDPTVGRLSVTSKTAAYTALTTDDLITCDTSGGAFTVTLFAASGNSGKRVWIKKTSTDLTALTIDANSTETIDGALTTSLNTFGEAIELVSNGTNWIVLQRIIPGKLNTYTPSTQGMGTVASVSFTWMRISNCIRVLGYLTTGTASAVEMQLGLPSGLAIASACPSLTVVGKAHTGTVINPANRTLTILATASDTFVNFSQTRVDSAINPLVEQTGSTLLLNTVKYSFDFIVPIEGWASP
jgi:hypothetical protein